MSRYIDANKLKQDMASKYISKGYFYASTALDCVDNAPTADVQEVVRCKDCKYSCEEKPVFGITDYSCIKLCIHCLDANDFCSYGAKMDEEE